MLQVVCLRADERHLNALGRELVVLSRWLERGLSGETCQEVAGEYEVEAGDK